MKASLLYVTSPNLPTSGTTTASSSSSPSNIDGNTLSPGTKVKYVEVHPSLPWTASIGDDGRVVVLDYIRGEILANFTTEHLQQWVTAESSFSSSYSRSGSSYGRRTTPRNSNNNNSSVIHTPASRSGRSVESKDAESMRSLESSFEPQVSSTKSGLRIHTGTGNPTFPHPPNSLSRVTPMGSIHMTPMANSIHHSPTSLSHPPPRMMSYSRESMSARIGQIQHIKFFDRHTIYWERYHTPSNAPSHDDYSSHIPTYLMVHCDHRIILVNLQYTSQRNPRRSVISLLGRKDGPKTPPTCMSEALSPTLLMFGSTTGRICIYDIESQKAVTTIRLSNTTDSVTQLMIVKGGLPPKSPSPPPMSSHPPNWNHTVTRFVALCSSGTAYLCQLDIQTDDHNGGYDISMAPILGRMEDILNSLETTGITSGKGIGYAMSYDADRDFLIGILSGGKRTGVWDLSTLHLPTTTTTPNVTPFLTLKLSGYDSGTNASLFVTPAMQCSSFPDTVFACWMGNKTTGEISILLSTLGGTNESMVMKPHLHHTFSLNAFQNHLPSRMRIYSMAIPRFRNHIVVCGTNIGVVVLSIEDDTKSLEGARHAALDEDSSTVRILHMEGSSLFVTTPHSSKPNPVGPLNLQNPALIYKSPDLASGESVIRLPPRLLISPSREFLSLFWHAESRYEILHIPSLLRTQQDSGQYPPPVDFGFGVVSFAWVGDNDSFAILHSVISPETRAQSTVPSSSSTKQGFSFKLKSKNSKKQQITQPSIISSRSVSDDGKRGTVELKNLIRINDVDLENVGSSAAAITTSLGRIMIRGGGRPTSLFGGPVLCIGSVNAVNGTPLVNFDRDPDKAQAYFYSSSRSTFHADGKVNGTSNTKASSFMTIGPSLPYPDLVVWSDDNKYCSICVGSKVTIFVSNESEFTLVGTTILAPNEVDSKIESAKFIHNVLYCTSRLSVQCIFFGPVNSSDEKVTDLESFIIASTVTPLFPRAKLSQESNTSFTNISQYCSAMTFGGGPSILAYFSGSLLVSTPTGIKAISLNHPLLRIGILISAGHSNRAQRWFDAVSSEHHESLARYLERRKSPELAITLSGLSLESIIDLSIKYSLTSALEDLIEEYGVTSIRQIDIANGGFDGGHSTIECVGAFLLSQGKPELVRRIASECIVLGDQARKEAFFLASLLISIDPGDAKRLLKRSVGIVRGKKVAPDDISLSWPAGSFARDHIL